MDLRKFDYFMKVADLGSFSRAAASLHISQPVLSRQVRRLEEELGLPLFYRNGRGVTLTRGGRCLLENARAMQAQLNTAMVELAAIKNALSGNASIGMPSSVGRVLTLPLVGHVRDHLPQVRLHIVEGYSGDILERLQHGRLDIAITYSATGAQGIVVDPVAVEELVLVSPHGKAPALPIGMETLLSLPLILPGRSHALRVELERAARACDRAFNIRLEVDALASLLRLVQAGFGHTVLPPGALAGDPGARSVAISSLTGVLPARTLYIASGPQRSDAAPARQLAALVRQQMLDLVGPKSWRPVTG